MREKQCMMCQHFRQHYTFDNRKIFRVNCGHCTFQRPLRKLPNTKACEHFLPGSPPETAFVSKEYLSKALLQYLFHLELLPSIEDNEDKIL